MGASKTVFATYDTFDELFPAQAREEFWNLVRNTLVEVFNTEPHLADHYHDQIEGATGSRSGAAREARRGAIGTGPMPSGKERVATHRPSAGERIAVYHTSALSIAADLAGWREPIPDEKLRAFLKLQRSYAKKFGIDLELPPNELRD